MKTVNVNWIRAILFGASIFFLTACDKTDEPMGSGDVEFQITDAPSDDASVQGVFITVADIKVDGKSISGFTKQTMDIKAYSEGVTKLLGTTHLDAKTYKDLTIVLDADMDAFGNSPGCYVFSSDGARYKLRNSGQIEIKTTKDWSVVANTKSVVVLDFDLRKAIRSMADATVRYNFVSNDDLQAAVRLMTKTKAGGINGSYTNQTTVSGDKIIVYAYKKGTFTASQESQPQGEAGILFKNALASTEVKQGLAGQTYKLAFLEEGEYELHFASYSKEQATGRFNFQNLLRAQADGTGAEFITIQGGITIAITSTITGIL